MSKLKAYVLCLYVDQVENSHNPLKLMFYVHVCCEGQGIIVSVTLTVEIWIYIWLVGFCTRYLSCFHKYLCHYPFSMEPFDKDFYVLWRISYYLSDPKI